MHLSYKDRMYYHHLDSLLDGHHPLFKHEEEIQKVTVPNTISEVHLSLKVNRAHQQMY